MVIMTKIYNQQNQKQIRKILRKQPIKAERMLWYRLKNKQLGYKFRRQFGVGKYVVDFYCPNLKIAIEVDGCTHSSDKELMHDKNREEFLTSVGVKTIRFFNSDIYNHIDEVIDKIIRTIKN